MIGGVGPGFPVICAVRSAPGEGWQSRCSDLHQARNRSRKPLPLYRSVMAQREQRQHPQVLAGTKRRARRRPSTRTWRAVRRGVMASEAGAVSEPGMDVILPTQPSFSTWLDTNLMARFREPGTLFPLENPNGLGGIISARDNGLTFNRTLSSTLGCKLRQKRDKDEHG